MSDLPPAPRSAPADPRAHELGSSMVEYVGLGAISATFVSGLAAAVDSAAGDRLGTAIARRLLEAISASG